MVFILAGGIFVFSAQDAHAAWSLWAMATGAVYKLIGDILSLIQKFFGLFLTLAANLLDAVFQLGKFRDVPVVNSGWQVTRGLCNMFLALILLIMAVSTVLQIETFGAKKILVRLVIVALLINFSLLFAGIIIDFSQVLTGYFIDAAKGTSGSISVQIMNGLSGAQILSGVPSPKIAPASACNNDCTLTGLVCLQNTAGTDVTYQCGPPPDPNTTAEAQIKQGDEGTLQVVIGYAFGAILTAIATFVVLAAAILLIFRIVALWLLLILSPLALVSWITGTAGLWNKWWSAFFKWTFFAPIYAFFLYLAVLTVGGGSFSRAFGNVRADVPPGIFNTLANSITLMLQYVVVVIILIGGLYAAQSLGIYGAGAVMSWGKKAGKATAKWTGRKATGYDRWAPALMAAGGAVVSKIPLLGKTGDIMKGKAIDMREKQMQYRENQLYAKLLSRLPENEVRDRVKNDRGIKQLMAARVASEKGYLKNADRETVQKAMETFKNFGMQKELQGLEEQRVDAIVDPVAMGLAFQRALDSGAYKNWSGAAFEGEKGKNLMENLRKNLSRSGFISTYNGWTQSTKKAAKEAMRTNFNNDFKDKDELYRRDIYAASTDNITHAYSVFSDPRDDKSGTLTGAGQTGAAQHIQGRTPAQLGAVGPGEPDIPDMELIGGYITPAQMRSVRGELSAVQKRHILNGAIKYGNKDALSEASRNMAWQV